MATNTFTVDAALLRELGERLVGHPHIALVELIKNAYDADARSVEVHLSPDSITVIDDGHGITEEEFLGKWLRIGSTHKEKERFSRDLKRALTGQKGVGRLAVQFLGRTLKLETVARASSESSDQARAGPILQRADGLVATIDWDAALRHRDLTQVTVDHELTDLAEVRFTNNSNHGVRLTIGKVSAAVMADLGPEKLAQRLWSLQPPTGVGDTERQFSVRVFDPSGRAVVGFDDAMQAHLRQWHAIIRGNIHAGVPNSPGKLEMTLEFEDRDRYSHSSTIPGCVIHAASFEIRVFSPHGRLRHGIKVGEFRDYLKEYGGVRLFDAGFQLPFYGGQDSDWLGVERDHAHRLTESKYLPPDLQEARGLNFLPTTSRLLGNVQVDTAAEGRWVMEGLAPTERPKEQPLTIAITRDRLIQNKAYLQLRTHVRESLDFYAMKEAARELAARKFEEAHAPIEAARSKVVALKKRIDEVAHLLPGRTADEFRESLDEIVVASTRAQEVQQVEAAVLSTLATAGLLALSQQHEHEKQIILLEDVLEEAQTDPTVRDQRWIGQLAGWIKRAKRTNELFAAYLEPDNRTYRERLPMRETIENIAESVKPLLRGTAVDTTALPPDELLPVAALAEWTAIFQNVMLNSVNAILEAEREDGRIRIAFNRIRARCSLRIEDNGSGIDLEKSERLFRPFERALPRRTGRDSVLGGSGLGLTIVRTLSGRIGCHATFVEPSKRFTTALELAWED